MSETAALLKVLNGERPERPLGPPTMSDTLWQHVTEFWAESRTARPSTHSVVRKMVWPHPDVTPATTGELLSPVTVAEETTFPHDPLSMPFLDRPALQPSPSLPASGGTRKTNNLTPGTASPSGKDKSWRRRTLNAFINILPSQIAAGRSRTANPADGSVGGLRKARDDMAFVRGSSSPDTYQDLEIEDGVRYAALQPENGGGDGQGTNSTTLESLEPESVGPLRSPSPQVSIYPIEIPSASELNAQPANYPSQRRVSSTQTVPPNGLTGSVSTHSSLDRNEVKHRKSAAEDRASAEAMNAIPTETTTDDGGRGLKARALYAYTASEDDSNELSFNKGEILDIEDAHGKWWQTRKTDGSLGLAPSNYLVIIPAEGRTAPSTGNTSTSSTSVGEPTVAPSNFPVIIPAEGRATTSTRNTSTSSTTVGEPTDDYWQYKAKALYRYEASEDDPSELSFVKGEILDILDRRGKWWQAKKTDGSIGIAPSNYLLII
ncbi:SH3 domain-containing protein [Mycena sanguinolenta]|uniref:SH3 domain-containing protein n=1 Tax=Mycena sanguinolenta TaxID=230812 RepID=A0A8H7DIA8_9AGAR|nr:SH3 domain-containing protein [Mycena sanguinolenta]